jgi:hypothetical protein
VARWQLPAAATLATVSVVVPLTALPLAASTLAAGAGGDLVLATLAASVLATAAYTGLFVAAGLWFRRAAWWGLAFVVFWENVVALSAEGVARFTVSEWARTILETASGVDVAVGPRSATAAFVILPAAAVAGWLLATVRYRRADVD